MIIKISSSSQSQLRDETSQCNSWNGRYKSLDAMLARNIPKYFDDPCACGNNTFTTFRNEVDTVIYCFFLQ